MPRRWDKTREDRRRDAETYGSAEYRRNREVAKRRAGGRCEECGHPHGRLQCDHIRPVSQGGTHHLDNLRMVCHGPGTCQCHEHKTSREATAARGSKASDPPVSPRTQW